MIMTSCRKNKLVSTAWIYSDCKEGKPKDNTMEDTSGRDSEMLNESDGNVGEAQEVVSTSDSSSNEIGVVIKQRQPPEGGNENFDEKNTESSTNTARFYVTPSGSCNGQACMRRSVSDQDIDVDIQIEVDLRELGTDIREIIASMENLKLELADFDSEDRNDGKKTGVSRNNSAIHRNESLKVNDGKISGQLVRKKSREAEDINRWSDPARQISQNSSIASRKTKNSANTPFGILRKSNLNYRRGYSSDDNILKNKEILNVTSLVNENFDESKIFKTSAACVNLGRAPPVTRYVKQSTKKNAPNSNGTPRNKAPSPNYGGFAAIQLYPPREQWRILRNLIAISFSFMIIYTAYYSTLFLQKSFHTAQGLRLWHIVAECAACMIAATTLPTLIIKWLGSKWAMVVSCVLCIPYFITQFVAEYITILPTSAILGIGMSILWAAQGTYLSVMAEAYTVITDVEKDTALFHFFGIFYFIFFSYIVWSSLAASEVFANETGGLTVFGANFSSCGTNFCPENVMVAVKRENIPEGDEQIVWGFLLALAIVPPILIGLAVDTLSRYNEGNRLDKTKKETQCEHVSGSLAQFVNKFQLFLAPLIMLLSMSDPTLTMDFWIGYFSCVHGAPHLRDLMLCYGVFLLIFCLLVGCCAVRLLGRITTLVGSFCLFLTVIAVLKFWDPIGHKTVVFFIISAIWAIPQTSVVVISVLQGILFVGKEEAAFSTFVFWRFAGNLILYVIQPSVCMNTILLVVFVVLLISVAGYVIFELTWKEAPHLMNQRTLSIVSSDGMVEIPLGSPTKGQFY
ncbi:UNC93-like protein [Anabrus simplex]|uniref:UNC93-like protein n=1 Tax=Anabrus simplex TaxID=316456 RepID=UPI0035A3BC76